MTLSPSRARVLIARAGVLALAVLTVALLGRDLHLTVQRDELLQRIEAQQAAAEAREQELVAEIAELRSQVELLRAQVEELGGIPVVAPDDPDATQDDGVEVSVVPSAPPPPGVVPPAPPEVESSGPDPPLCTVTVLLDACGS